MVWYVTAAIGIFNFLDETRPQQRLGMTLPQLNWGPLRATKEASDGFWLPCLSLLIYIH